MIGGDAAGRRRAPALLAGRARILRRGASRHGRTTRRENAARMSEHAYRARALRRCRIDGDFWRERLETVLDAHHPEPAREAREERHPRFARSCRSRRRRCAFPRNEHGFTMQVFLGFRRRQVDRGGELRARHRRDADDRGEDRGRSSTISRRRSRRTAISTAGIIGREPENRWTNLRDNHELYNAGHMLEGADRLFPGDRPRSCSTSWSATSTTSRATFGPRPGPEARLLRPSRRSSSRWSSSTS